jgi:hypothetical protein
VNGINIVKDIEGTKGMELRKSGAVTTAVYDGGKKPEDGTVSEFGSAVAAIISEPVMALDLTQHSDVDGFAVALTTCEMNSRALACNATLADKAVGASTVPAKSAEKAKPPVGDPLWVAV